MDYPDNIFVPETLSKPTLRSPSFFLLFGWLALGFGLYVATQLFPSFSGLHSLPSASPVGINDASVQDVMYFLSVSLGVLGVISLPAAVWYSSQPKTPPLRLLIGIAALFMGLAPVFYALGQPESYAFYDFARWLYYWHAEMPLREAFFMAGSAGLSSSALLFVAIVLGLTGQKYLVSSAHGSASWGDGKQFAHGNAQTRIGRWFGTAKERGFPLGWFDERMMYDRTGNHVYVQAPTGSGKSRGFVVPALLMHDGSVLAIDIKRELYHVTSKRRYEINGAVHRLDPFARDVETDAYNPLDFVQTRGLISDTAGDDARQIASMIVVETGKENNPFFVRSAQQLLAGLILYVSMYAKDDEEMSSRRHLGEVRRLLMQDDEQLRALFVSMGSLDPSTITPPTGPASILASSEEEGVSVSNHVLSLVAETGNQFSKMNGKEFTSVVSTAREQTAFLSSPRIQKALASTTFNFSDMRTNPQGATIYLCLPDDRLDTYFRWLRLMIVSAQIEITRLDMADVKCRGKALFMLEEFPRLSKMRQVNHGIALHRSYGIQYVVVTQTPSQLIDVYGSDAATNIRENCHIKVAWSPDSASSAEEISKLCGTTTVATTSDSSNKSRSKGSKGGGRNKSVSRSIQEKERPLVTPDEARRTPSEYAFVIHRGSPPMLVRRPDYVTDSLFEGMADPHPTYASEEDLDRASRRRVARGYERPLLNPAEFTNASGPISSTPGPSPTSGVGDGGSQSSDSSSEGGGSAESQSAATTPSSSAISLLNTDPVDQTLGRPSRTISQDRGQSR